MGMARLPAVQAGLLSALPVNTPAAVVQHAGMSQERACAGTLATLADAVRAHGLGSPAIVIVIVGNVLQGRATQALTADAAEATDAAHSAIATRTDRRVA